jgi:hypothetical protein
MNEFFLPYKESLALQELGFNEDVFEWYDTETEDFCDIMKEVRAPLYQQAFKFFRNKYKLECCIDNHLSQYYYNKDLGVHKETYEEAELACIQKLIEIAKSNSLND